MSYQLDIQHHAVIFALLAKYSLEVCGTEAESILYSAVSQYGFERGVRMANRARCYGDEPNVWNYQVYAERISKSGVTEKHVKSYEPEYVSCITKCAWCEIWKEYGLLDYGKYYCKESDKGIMRGYLPGFELKLDSILTDGGSCCSFNWGFALDEEIKGRIKEKKASLADEKPVDYDYHTGHIYHTVSAFIIRELGEKGKKAVKMAEEEFARLFTPAFLEIAKASYPID